jgi:arsenate reductase
MEKRRVLFLCTGNSARSQMAEAIVNHDLGDAWLAFSAGTQPAAVIHPMAVAALAEIGVEHHGVTKSTDLFRGQDFELVITLCDDAAQNCPVWLGQGKRIHIGFPDPAEAGGSPDEQMAVFRRVRDDIRVKIPAFLAAYSQNLA